MILDRIAVGQLEANCYIVGCERTRKAFVIDPGADPALIMARIEAVGATIVAILNTHGHGDHIGANDALREEYGAPVLIAPADGRMLVSAEMNLSGWVGDPIDGLPATRLLTDKEVLQAGDVSLEVIFTPGHTEGGCCFYGENLLFSGDTLFWDGIGRTDLPGGSLDKILASIRNRLFTLPDSTRVLPGHGPGTNIGTERRNNPYAGVKEGKA